MLFSPLEKDQQGFTDYRVLYMEMEFHQILFSNLLEAAIALVRAINDFQGDQFLMDWNVNNRKVSQNSVEKAIFQSSDKLIICADGIVKSSSIYNTPTFRQYKRSLFQIPSAVGDSLYSIDYPDSFQQELVPSFENDKLLKEAILRFFQIEGKKTLGYRNPYDSGCVFLGGKHYRKTTPELFWGKIVFYVSVAACDRFLDKAAEQLESVLLLLTDILKYANGRIGIGAKKNYHMSPYMTYFGKGYDNVDGSHLDTVFSPREWYPYYYICGVEWMNYLSALPSSRIQREHINVDGVISFQKNDGMVVKSRHPISESSIKALSELKSVVSSVLYPGRTSIDLKKLYSNKCHLYSMLPRCNWEIVPISSNEVSVKDSIVTFSHQV